MCVSRLIGILSSCVVALACGRPASTDPAQGDPAGDRPVLSLSSPAFTEGREIPTDCTCQGADAAPPLRFTAIPEHARSLLLVMRDIDGPPSSSAVDSGFVHWVVYDLPPDTDGLPGGSPGAPLPSGAKEGRNDFDRSGYGGPCPPAGGRHRYVFTLHALDVVLGDRGVARTSEIVSAAEGHVLAQARLSTTYERRNRLVARLRRILGL